MNSLQSLIRQLDSVNLPGEEIGSHRIKLRRQLLISKYFSEEGGELIMVVKKAVLYTALLLAVVGMAAILVNPAGVVATGRKVFTYFSERVVQLPGGRKGVEKSVIVTDNPDREEALRQADERARMREEIEELKAQGKGVLIEEKEGLKIYEYTLRDGRKVVVGESTGEGNGEYEYTAPEGDFKFNFFDGAMPPGEVLPGEKISGDGEIEFEVGERD